jgi:hypothetical protein
MRGVPENFSVAFAHQEVPRAVLTQIEDFIGLFDRVTTRPAWQATVVASAPAIARPPRGEVCFFTAWDFHVPRECPDRWQLIECNDNGSGMIFAAVLNRVYYEASRFSEPSSVEAPPTLPAFEKRVARIIESEGQAFFAGPMPGMVMILDDADSIAQGKFRDEFALLRDLCRHEGLRCEIGAPADTTWEGVRLRWRGEPVAFVANRSTDFFWEGDGYATLRSAYADGGVYIAPNPFSYSTRSDKRLLTLLSNPVWDEQCGIRDDERLILSAHVPETILLRPENVEVLARDRDDWFFKPCHGFASRGLLPGSQVGVTRLRRIIKKGVPYVAQRRVPKWRLDLNHGEHLWVDLRVWAYRGERLLLSGRASRDPDRMDLSTPGGWMPTYSVG